MTQFYNFKKFSKTISLQLTLNPGNFPLHVYPAGQRKRQAQAGGQQHCLPGRSSSPAPFLQALKESQAAWLGWCDLVGETLSMEAVRRSSPPDGVVSERYLYLLWCPVKNPTLPVAPEVSFTHRSLLSPKSATKGSHYTTDLLHSLCDFTPPSPALTFFFIPSEMIELISLCKG